MSQALRVRFLGTGTSMGVPVVGCTCYTCTSPDRRDKRLRSSIVISSATTDIVIDCGPDFRQQMLLWPQPNFKGIAMTHEHKDHTAGLDDVRAFNLLSGLPVTVYATERVERALRDDYHYAFQEPRYPGVPEIAFSRIRDTSFTAGDIVLKPIEVMHHLLPVTAYRVGNFTYITDANAIPDAAWKALKGTRTLVLNALRQQPHLSHFTLDEAVELGKKSGAERVYFTHISHQMGRHEEVNATLPEGFSLAFDGLEISI